MIVLILRHLYYENETSGNFEAKSGTYPAAELRYTHTPSLHMSCNLFSFIFEQIVICDINSFTVKSGYIHYGLTFQGGRVSRPGLCLQWNACIHVGDVRCLRVTGFSPLDSLLDPILPCFGSFGSLHFDSDTSYSI